MIVMGIDPGTATTGFGFVREEKGRLTLLHYGVIKTSPDTDTSRRLKIIHDGLVALITAYQPDCLAVEQLFFNKNVRSALAVGHARGVVMLAAAQHQLAVEEYTPLQVKQAVAGYGRAEKNQVQNMVRTLLHMEVLPKPDDAADALAIAICHSHSHRSRNLRLPGGAQR